jgi:nicotinamidase-related amidase
MDRIFRLDKQRTALVVIDLQKGIAAMEARPHGAQEVIRNAAQLAAAFRGRQMPVFLVRVATAPDAKDRLNPVVEVTWSRPAGQMPSDWSEMVPELAPETGDFIITKKQWGAFYDTGLDLQLRRRGMNTIVLCGIATNFGVESTARFAYEYGYNQIFAEDAMSSMAAEDHEFAVKKIFPRLGLVRSTQEILDSIMQA